MAVVPVPVPVTVPIPVPVTVTACVVAGSALVTGPFTVSPVGCSGTLAGCSRRGRNSTGTNGEHFPRLARPFLLFTFAALLLLFGFLFLLFGFLGFFLFFLHLRFCLGWRTVLFDEVVRLHLQQRATGTSATHNGSQHVRVRCTSSSTSISIPSLPRFFLTGGL